MSRAIDRANHNGVFWKDIDWNKPIHVMKTCTCCGIDGGELIGVGHASCCYYGTGVEHAAAEKFFRSEIEKAIAREAL